MTANFTEIEKALIVAVRNADSTTPTGYPNQVLSDEQRGNGLWLQIHNLRAQSAPATLGNTGEDNHPGILQIDVNAPQGQGSKDALSKSDQLARHFTPGKFILYNNQVVRIESYSLGPGRYVGGYYRISLSITYSARTNRS